MSTGYKHNVNVCCYKVKFAGIKTYENWQLRKYYDFRKLPIKNFFLTLSPMKDIINTFFLNFVFNYVNRHNVQFQYQNRLGPC